MSPQLYIYLLLRTAVGVALSFPLTALLYGVTKAVFSSFGLNL